MEPVWISEDVVQRLHTRAIDVGGGSDGLRSPELLVSALANPSNLWAYGEEDIFVLAVAHAEALARNHPFVDGNKRSALLTAIVFLKANGWRLKSETKPSNADMMVELAQGNVAREVMAEHLRGHADLLGPL